jgi:hypothetical protein
MFVEHKTVLQIGTSLGVTFKEILGPMLKKGEQVKVTYTSKKITIERAGK